MIGPMANVICLVLTWDVGVVVREQLRICQRRRAGSATSESMTGLSVRTCFTRRTLHDVVGFTEKPAPPGVYRLGETEARVDYASTLATGPHGCGKTRWGSTLDGGAFGRRRSVTCWSPSTSAMQLAAAPA